MRIALDKGIVSFVMAEVENTDTGPICKGSVLSVTIEEALADVLIVCLKHGAKVYSGCLLDSNKCDMPYGVGFDRFRLQCESKEKTEGAIVTVKPSGPSGKEEVSALSLRHTFLQDTNSTPHTLLPSPTYKTCITKPLRDKNIRSMRLRPRQVLCTRCKQGIHDTEVLTNTTPDISNDSPQKLEGYRKRRFLEDIYDSPKKQRKIDNISSKTSPVIKISFSSAKGQEQTIVKIPSKNQEEETDSGNIINPENKRQEDIHAANIQEEYKKLKKALKKAKLKEKMSKAGENGECEQLGKHHHKKSKRNKHKKKHKHKDIDDLMQQAQNGEHRNVIDENEGSLEIRDSGFADKEPDDKEKEQWDYVDRDPQYLSTKASLKENSLNVPSKGKMKGMERSFESSKWSTSSGNSDRSSMYDDNSDPEQLENDDLIQQGPNGDVMQHDDNSDSDNEMKIRPLMMRIQTKNVAKCQTKDGRTLGVGDVVWGKITGFPWWPGKIISITVSQRDNGVILKQMAHISWFGSPTMSHMPCSTLFNFLEDFKNRFNKKKRGSYKIAIKQATIAAQSVQENAQVVEGDLQVDLED